MSPLAVPRRFLIPPMISGQNEAKKLLVVFRQNLEYDISGCDPDILNEFPAQRLIRVIFDQVEPVDWPTFWPANGGKLHGGEMVALKWDPVWWKISAFGLPVAPFQIGSGYDLEDVDRDDAEKFGLMKRRERPPALKITVDLAELKTRIAAALPAACNAPNRY